MVMLEPLDDVQRGNEKEGRVAAVWIEWNPAMRQGRVD